MYINSKIILDPHESLWHIIIESIKNVLDKLKKYKFHIDIDWIRKMKSNKIWGLVHKQKLNNKLDILIDKQTREINWIWNYRVPFFLIINYKISRLKTFDLKTRIHNSTEEEKKNTCTHF